MQVTIQVNVVINSISFTRKLRLVGLRRVKIKDIAYKRTNARKNSASPSKFVNSATAMGNSINQAIFESTAPKVYNKKR